MKILAFDTATPATAVALMDEPRGVCIQARDDPAPGSRPAHATHLMPMIVELLERSGTGWEQLDRIAVGTGPGTFTGLRIGVATARALALARQIPIVGVSTLRSLALNGVEANRLAGRGDAVLAVIDARRGEVFAAAWSPTGSAPLLGPRAIAPESLAQMLPDLGRTVLAIGDGAVRFRVVLELRGASIPDDGSEFHRVTAVNHCQLAGELPVAAAGAVRPDYLRIPDAEITRRAARS
jgi:tRNA threonylcarbamoyladenosine biosynthesis protein TsaB